MCFLTAFNAVDTPTASIDKNSNIITLKNGATFHPSKCWFKENNDSIDCGWLHTAPAKGSKKSAFQLPVVIFRYKGANKNNDPIVYLSGGPGAGAFLDKELIQSFWRNIWDNDLSHLKRDLVLFDQRGSGLSKPKIDCPQYREHSIHLLTTPGTPVENAQTYREATLKCRQTLEDAGLPINQLATHYSAHDVADIMEALNYKEWNIQGVSYGTRLGIEIQRRYPKNVRTLTLDSSYPPSAHLFQDWPVLLNASLERIFKNCEVDSSCTASSNEFRERFWGLMERLKNDPVVFTIQSPRSTIDHMTLNDETLLAVLFHAEYQSEVLPYLADALFELEQYNYAAFQNYIEDYVINLFDGSSSDAVYWAVECHDNPVIDPNKYKNYNTQHERLSHYLPEDNDVCAIWNQGYNYVALNNKKQTETPVLIFSGEDDPITPSNWAVDSAAAFDNNAYLFSFYGISHSVMDNMPCATDLYGSFVNNPSQRPRANCRIVNEISNDESIAEEESNEDVEVAEQVESDADISNNDNDSTNQDIAITTADAGEKKLPHRNR